MNPIVSALLSWLYSLGMADASWLRATLLQTPIEELQAEVEFRMGFWPTEDEVQAALSNLLNQLS